MEMSQIHYLILTTLYVEINKKMYEGSLKSFRLNKDTRHFFRILKLFLTWSHCNSTHFSQRCFHLC